MKLKHLLSSLLLAAVAPSVSMAAGATRLNYFLPLNSTNDVQLIANKTVSIWGHCKTESGFNVLRIYGVTTSQLTGTILNGIDQYTGVDGDFLPPTVPPALPDATATNAELLTISAPVGEINWGNNDPYYGYIIDTNATTPPAVTVPPALPPETKAVGLAINSGSAALGVTPDGCFVSLTVEPIAGFKALIPKPPKK